MSEEKLVYPIYPVDIDDATKKEFDDVIEKLEGAIREFLKGPDAEKKDESAI